MGWPGLSGVGQDRQSRAEQSSAEQSRAEQSRAEQSRAEQLIYESAKLKVFCYRFTAIYQWVYTYRSTNRSMVKGVYKNYSL